MIDALDVQSAPITQQLRLYARRQPGCKTLMSHYGIGELTAVTILAELGDTRRFASSRQAVRYAGLDITVHQSDQRRAPGHLSAKDRPRCVGHCSKPPRPPAAQFPDRAYYDQAAERLGGNRACLALARKLLKRSFHTLRELGDDALLPPDDPGARKPFTHPMHCGPLPALRCRHQPVDGLQRLSGRLVEGELRAAVDAVKRGPVSSNSTVITVPGSHRPASV